MVRNSLFIMLLFAVLGLCVFTPEYAHAQPVIGNNSIGANGEVCPSNGFTGRVVICIKNAIRDGTTVFFNEFYTYFKTSINLAMILGVTLYGVLLAAGHVENIPRDTFVLVLKIGAIIYFTSNFPAIYNLLLEFTEGLLQIVTSATSSSSGNLKCSSGNVLIWTKIDCALNLVLGIAPGVTVTTGIVGVLTALLASSSYGAIIFLMGVTIILTLLFGIVRAVFIYVNAFMALTLMCMISPFMIPLILFRYTKPMFDKWLKMTLGFVLQPVFLFAYLSLMLTAFDTMVFSGNSSLYVTMAGQEAKNENFKIGEYFRKNDLFQPKTVTILNFDTNPLDVGGEEGEQQSSGFYSDVTNYAKDAASKGLDSLLSSVGLGFTKTVVDLKKWAQIRGKPSPQAFFREVFISFLMAALLSYLMYTLLSYIPSLGVEVSGGALDGFNLNNVGGMPGGRMLSSTMGGGKK